LRHDIPSKIIPCDDDPYQTYPGMTLSMDKDDGALHIWQEDGMVTMTNVQAWALVATLQQMLMMDRWFNGGPTSKPTMAYSKEPDAE
jgi:hypothetical protein